MHNLPLWACVFFGNQHLINSPVQYQGVNSKVITIKLNSYLKFETHIYYGSKSDFYGMTNCGQCMLIVGTTLFTDGGGGDIVWPYTVGSVIGPMTPYTHPFWRLAGITGANGSIWN